MISKKQLRTPITEVGAEKGHGILNLDKLNNPPIDPSKVRTFAHARLNPGALVGYHVHHGESETYYILSGKALYSDNGTEVELTAGDTTFTPDGCGHSIQNIGDNILEFMVLIVLD